MKNLFYFSISILLLLTSCATNSVLSESFIDGRMLNGKGLTIVEAVRDGGNMVAGKIPAKQRVVVLGFAGEDETEAAWASDELLQFVVSAKKHTVVDRRGLDVRYTQKTPTGEILERSAKDIGYLVGAEFVLFGNISEQYRDNIRYLNLKAMDVRTGDIIATTTEKFAG